MGQAYLTEELLARGARVRREDDRVCVDMTPEHPQPDRVELHSPVTGGERSSGAHTHVLHGAGGDFLPLIILF